MVGASNSLWRWGLFRAPEVDALLDQKPAVAMHTIVDFELAFRWYQKNLRPGIPLQDRD